MDDEIVQNKSNKKIYFVTTISILLIFALLIFFLINRNSKTDDEYYSSSDDAENVKLRTTVATTLPTTTTTTIPFVPTSEKPMGFSCDDFVQFMKANGNELFDSGGYTHQDTSASVWYWCYPPYESTGKIQAVATYSSDTSSGADELTVLTLFAQLFSEENASSFIIDKIPASNVVVDGTFTLKTAHLNVLVENKASTATSSVTVTSR